jgi:hypothetical protein
VPKCEIKAEWRRLRSEEFLNPYFSTNIERATEIKVIELDSQLALMEK